MAIAATSGTSGTLSSAGIGSGLDVSNIIASLMKVESLPLTNLQTAYTGLQTKLSAFGQMQSLVSAFHDATAPLFDKNSYAVTTTSSSDTTAVNAGSSTTAVTGSYSVAVSALSSTQSTVSATGQFSDGTAVVGTGSMTITLGTWSANQTSFTPKSGATAITIPIGASENTLAGIRDKINASNAGVSATIVTDSTGARLALQSTATGAANGFRVSVADDDGSNADATGLSRLAFDPPNGAAQQTLTQAATNTQATINGIAVSTDSNTLTNVVGGISFTLSKVTPPGSPVTVTVSNNTDAIKTQLTSFVTAYNALNSFLSNETAYDPTAKQGALLQGDATTTGLQQQLRAMVSQFGSASGTFNSLSSIGIEFQKDGSLALDDTKVSAAVQNLPELTKAMTNVDLANPSNNGFAKKLADWADGLVSSNGSLTTKQSSIQSQLTSNEKDQDSLNTRLAATQARLTAQYTALDATMSQANSLQAYVTQQITTWNKSTA